MYFTAYTPIFPYEVTMRMIPNFLPRGHGMYVIIRSETKEEIIAGCYCRLSDDDDRDGTSVSIETQMRILSDYCREHHFTVYDQYCDDGFTGTNFNRPSFKRMMRDAEAKFDRLYDDRLDGILSDKKFKELSAKCEAEQESASARLAELKSQAADRTDSVQGITQFMKTAEQYDEVTELDKELLNRLVDSIVVGDRIKTANGCEQVVTVNYKFIGEI